MTSNKDFPENNKPDIKGALLIAYQYAAFEDTEKRMWVIDQMCRRLLGSRKKYEAWVAELKNGHEGPNTYDWETGIEP